MKNKILIASFCSLLISCVTPDGAQRVAESELDSMPASSESSSVSPQTDSQMPSLELQEPSAISESGDGSDAHNSSEAQAAEAQESHMDVANEQRSNSELDNATPAVGATDSFYGSSQQPEQTPELLPVDLPEKGQASYDEAPAPERSYAEPKPKAKKVVKKSVKKSKAVAKKSAHKKAKVAKKSGKSKKALAKNAHKKSAKKSKAVAKKVSKAECKKIAKNSKKASKRQIAECKISKKVGKKIARK